MDSQAQTEMSHKAIPQDRDDNHRPREDVTEENFLKDLYLFMKKRDTPIERIPHLGFKQIDLYLMYKTVEDLGGYHQVTAQQLWKQVYNTLGGNPRSTSAATCTRRHYEKLMLPYECHIKGLRLNSVLQPRSYHYMGYRSLEEDGPPPAKRRPELFSLQSLPGVLAEHHSGLFPLSPSYPKFYFAPYPYPTLPPSLMTSPPPSYLACTAPIPSSAERPPPVAHSTEQPNDPLEHLRCLAKQYESSAGLSEPLNLSVKASPSRITTSPVSSFAPPASNKNPKFLNKPSPLYSPQNANVKSDSDGDGAAPLLNRLKETDFNEHNKDTAERPQNPKVGHINELISSTGQKGGRMEIEIPLSVFNNWLQMYRPQSTSNGSRQFLTQEDARTKGSEAQTVAANLTFEFKQSKSEEGNSRHMPRQTSQLEPPGQYHRSNHNSAYGFLAANKDVGVLSDVQKPCSLKSVPTVCLDLTGSKEPTPSKQASVSTSPATLPQDLRASKPHVAKEQVPQWPQPEALQLNKTSTLQLTPEEVMKLRKIISNSA